MLEQLRIVIGSGPRTRIAALVAEHSILKHTRREVEVIHTFDKERPTWKGYPSPPDYSSDRDPTEFSFVRLWVPDLCGRKGTAVYMDSDMIVFDDVARLFEMPMGDKWVLSTSDPSVIRIDCSKVPWDVYEAIDRLNSKKWTYPEAIHRLCLTPTDKIGTLPEEWNHREFYQPGLTKLLHYTHRITQPGIHPVGTNQLEGLWYRALAEAVEAGRVDEAELNDNMLNGLNRYGDD